MVNSDQSRISVSAQPIKVGIIGDFNPSLPYHKATNDSLVDAAGVLSTTVEITWLPTSSLEDASTIERLRDFDALWCAPGSPYASMNGALNAIRSARERDLPFIGT